MVVTSTLIQGATFEPLARLLGVTSSEPALPPPLIETGIIRELGGESLVWKVRQGDAAAGHMVKELGLPREALVNLIVRDGEALPPRGSTEIEAGDELHVVSRLEAFDELSELAEKLARRAARRAAGAGDAAARAPRCSPSGPGRPRTGSPATRESVEGVPVAHRLRTRRDVDGALVALADGRYAATSADLLAIGGRRRLAEWCARRVARQGLSAGRARLVAGARRRARAPRRREPTRREATEQGYPGAKSSSADFSLLWALKPVDRRGGPRPAP